MSIESEILRIQHNIANTYAAVSNKGGEVPLQPTSENLPAAVESIPQGPTYTAGDGIEITQTEAGPKIGVTTPVRGIVTQEEFDALTEAEQNKGLYVISDSGGSGGGGDSGTGSPALEVYSTEEQVIGTWIDGKPIYRKVFEKNLTSNAATAIFDTTDLNIDTFVSAHAFVLLPDSNDFFCVNTYLAGNNSPVLYLNKNFIQILLASLSTANRVYAVAEYTKTTDEGVTT